MHTIETPFGRPGFLVLAGSRLYGIETPESDYDYVGAIVEPMDYRIGLNKHGHQQGFEQHTFKYDAGNRLNPDPYEGTIYSLWKLAQMLAEGNPTSLCTLFATPTIDRYGICTDAFRSLVLSKRSGHRFLKYMEAQRKSMIGQRSKGIARTAIIEAHGYDTKFAGNLIRLGYQGIEFLKTGTITLPMPDHERKMVGRVRCGIYSEDDVIMLATNLQADMEDALAVCTLPEEPQWDALSAWVTDMYLYEWGIG